MDYARRDFMSGLTLAAAAGLLGVRPGTADAEPPPETKRIRLLNRPTICEAPQYVAEELLRGEGFDDIKYLPRDPGPAEKALAVGEADITMLFGAPVIVQMDSGAPIVFLAGVHIGCIEVVAHERVRTFRDLKGRRVAATHLGSAPHVFLSSIAAHVGLNPNTDITWAAHPVRDWLRLLADGKIDAFLGFPPLTQEARSRRIGHVILNTLTDRPWSQYFCCMVAGHKDFVRRHPIATKRALRAILKASEICALEPERVAGFLVDRGYAERLDFALQSLKEVVYGKWREYNAADAVRFYALRLHEAGLIKSNPQKILSQHTDWRFVNELKKELKG